jgi:hypothetical protein
MKRPALKQYEIHLRTRPSFLHGGPLLQSGCCNNLCGGSPANTEKETAQILVAGIAARVAARAAPGGCFLENPLC